MSIDPVSRLEQAIDLAEMSHNVSLDGIRAAIERHVAEAVARETERCVKACRSVVDAGPENGCCPTFWNDGAEACEKAIRAKGTT